ncbi:MAG: 30S ribosomal protein S4 [Candidatus Komeilibacteria bacterium RIFOXYC1_FULL_37_11]|uniref:Small ribosomal subunit protein uS4 n=1 Tax=Candidatus Komeilibacteria bacterium RIFOXYC1_FULL_37_11 TaxID=1798555 RepID=A0A1G2BZS1_9BACT|nr:MAG: 30S ribosomal protein S4 [Candidatus Komeilibacteria bacterium RIFOXYC1_FULL_37_11]OGY95483.1 MAG: 30S ribosomal protein S4 [Candidatus Komeilibacteria bacterium RIFOXYD1_FULL_37_29]OGY96257.1 MAG: 30S ribosomal protein S4 [Candidatus Komeilibacteria bacterium RIFOXYD2_FULL_37_8]
MARNLKPRYKASRRFGENVADTLKQSKKNYPAGMHGPKKAFTKTSEYGRQLQEKQKAKAIYGMLEKQFKLTFEKSTKLPGDLGQNFLTMLETRLDNVVYRAGLAQTRRLARQLVNHGHFIVDGVSTDIPSFRVQPGQVIKVKDNKIKKGYWSALAEKLGKAETAGWLSLDVKNFTITVNSLPNKEDLPANIDMPLIVDFYSR